MFDMKTKFCEEIKSYIVTIKKVSIRRSKRIALGNKQAIVNKCK